MKKINFYIFGLSNKYIFINLIFLTSFVLFINILEISRIINVNESSFKLFFLLTILKTPLIISEIIPFVIIIAISFLFKNLISNNELISIRNVGLSIIDIFKPIAMSIFIYGLIIFTIINPLTALSELKFEEITSKKSLNINSIKFIDNGMWIKNFKKDSSKNFFNISEINLDSMEAKNIKILNIENKSKNLIISEDGKIEGSIFYLNKVKIFDIDNNQLVNKNKYELKLNFESNEIKNSLINYKYVPFYKYKEHINTLKKFNLHTDEISLHYLSEIFKPFFLIIIGFVVMGFSGKFKRNENFFKVLFLSALIGFLIFLFKEIVINLTKEIKLNFILSYLFIFTLPLIIGIYQINKIEND